MKKMFVLFVCFGLYNVPGKSQSTSSVTESAVNHQNNNYTITVNDESGSLKIEVEGNIVFNDNETAIKSMSKEGYLRYKKNGKKLTAEPGNDGKIYYAYNGGEKTLMLNNEGSRFLAEAVKTMIEHGVDIEGHTEKLYAKGGTAAVLNGVDAMQSDYIKSRMIEYLLKQHTLSADDMTTVANKTATQISSDYEKAKLLSQFSDKYLSDKQTAAAYLTAVKSINSDYEKAGAVKQIFNEPLNDEMFTQVMAIANSVNSDYEKAGILEDIISNNMLNENRFMSVIAATKNISSDYEKANVLKTVFALNDIPQQNFNVTIASISSIGSDFEKSGVLQKLADKKTSSEQYWISIIQAAQNISSDYEKANTLHAIAANMPNTEKVRSAFKTAAKSISSEYEYGKLAKSVDL